MIYLSLAVIFLMAIVHLPPGHSALDPISWELQGGNPVAWLLMAGLCGVVGVFCRRLKQSGHSIRTAILLLDIVGLAIIAFTPPTSKIHEGTLEVVVVLTLIWFTIMALDYDCQVVVHLSALCVVLLLPLTFFSMGLMEKGLIMYSLVCCNLLYYSGLDENSQARRLWN